MRKTMKVEVEVTVETNFPQYFTSAAMADEIRDKVFGVIREDSGYDVVAMTVTGVDE